MTNSRSSDLTHRTALMALLLGGLGSNVAIAAPAIFYLHNDHLGTPRVVTDQQRDVKWRADYMPFGETVIHTEEVTMPLRMPGQYYDSETGLHYNYYRDYDPTLGRYIQSDPIGLRAGLNTYIYAYQNPFTWIDPYGLLSVGEASAIGSVVGGAVGGAINGAITGASVGSTIPVAGTAAGALVGAVGGLIQGGATSALAGAANATFGLGGATFVGAATGGLATGGAALLGGAAGAIIPEPGGSLAGGALGGALGGANAGAASVVGGALGGAIGGALAAALCFGDAECRAELARRKSRCE